jgi:hypothetical protein
LHPVAAAPAEPEAIASALSSTGFHAAVVAAQILPCVSGSTWGNATSLTSTRGQGLCRFGFVHGFCAGLTQQFDETGAEYAPVFSFVVLLEQGALDCVVFHFWMRGCGTMQSWSGKTAK